MTIEERHIMRDVFMGRTILIVAFFSCWFWCNHISAATDQESNNGLPIRFLTVTLDGSGLEWMDKDANEKGIDLEIGGIVALDKNTAILHGCLRIGAGAIRSVLLRTENGGRLWIETMPPEIGNEIWDLCFDPSGFGFALAMWTVESPGSITLFKSTDRGKTWESVSEIPKKELFDIPVKMSFSNRKNGKIHMNSEEAAKVRTILTRDGGKKWKEIGAVPEKEFYEKYPQKPKWQSKGTDGSRWKFITTGSEEEKIIIFRRLAVEKTWKQVAVLSHKYGYHQGQILFRTKNNRESQ